MYKSVASVIVVFVFSFLASCSGGYDITHHQTSINDAKEIHVYEGLPHRMEYKLFKQESKRTDITKIADDLFYTPKVKANDDISKQLKEILSSPSSLMDHVPGKKCGGFHADYAVSWVHKDQEIHALICFGCGEILYEDGENSFLYDMSTDANKKLKKILKHFDSKRPRMLAP